MLFQSKSPSKSRAGVIRHGGWQLTSQRLPSLNPQSIKTLLHSLKLSQREPSSIALIVDCVVGLASGISSQPPWDLMRATHSPILSATGAEYPRFGRASAEAYFLQLLRTAPETSDLPRRQCEILARANSVFLTRPFQKNIQTGTYRIWKDLSETEAQWLNFWPFQDEAKARQMPWFFEAYPSWVWREVFGLRTRDLKLLRPAVEKTFLNKSGKLAVEIGSWPELLKNPDAADAAVLALGALKLQSEGCLMKPYPEFLTNPLRLTEGWIMGLKA
ncbi:MAG: hypothetical protein H7222_13155 [Methylotenera sp.]|nr:hypothetical protein [Oligoflexia bacterium]